MTATDARPASTDAEAGDNPASAPSSGPLRPGRMETDRLATRVATAPGRETKTVTSQLTGEVMSLGTWPKTNVGLTSTAKEVTAVFMSASPRGP